MLNSISLIVCIFVCKCVNWEEKHCKPLIGNSYFACNEDDDDEEETVGIEERKENKLDRFTFMNVDGWIFGIHTFVGIITEVVLFWTNPKK